MSDESEDIRAIDLFCGAGGFSNGFESAGVNVIAGFDVADDALKTFENSHDSEAINHDIRDGVPDRIANEDYDIIFGSPPCKGFSDARGSRYVDDKRNGLVFEYIHWLEKLQPKIAVMENVTGIRTIGKDFMKGVKKEFRDIGYDSITVKELNSADFGVPQKRKRVIVVATHKRTNYEATLPKKDGNVQRTTVKEALEDLPDVTEDGIVEPRYSKVDMSTEYSEYVRDLEDNEKIHNHKAKDIGDEKQIANKIVSRLDPGEMYRSNRFGDRYRQVWDILEDEFTNAQNDVMLFIGKHRSKKDYRIKGKTVGHVDVDMIKRDLKYSDTEIQNAIDDLLSDEWLRKDEVDGRTGYDLNTNSGIRPRYMRLQPNSPSNTILTTDFKPRDKLHPFKNRGLSLREGARIQSFPDSFTFKGSFQSIASQIGNAVPPLMAYHIAVHLVEKLR